VKPATQTLRTIDLPMGEGRANLRIALTRDEAGNPETLLLAAGFGAGFGGRGHRPGWKPCTTRVHSDRGGASPGRTWRRYEGPGGHRPDPDLDPGDGSGEPGGSGHAGATCCILTTRDLGTAVIRS